VSIPPSIHRRPLPEALIPFSSEAGRALFREALESGHLETFFPLIEQFHTQSDPAFCGLGSLVMVLNALGVDPGRTWRGPWRWFSEELLDCCTPLAKVRDSGVTLDEVACLARCNGAEVQVGTSRSHSLEDFRAGVELMTRSPGRMLIASYSRSALGQTGEGHFSPIGGYHPAQDKLLVLDVARFKYPPHWVELPVMFEAMRSLDPVTGRPRGWLGLRKRDDASAIARFLVCLDGIETRALVERALGLQSEAFRRSPPESLDAVFRISATSLEASGLVERVRLRAPETAEHRPLFEELVALAETLPLYRRAADLLGRAGAGRVTLWWLAAPAHVLNELPPPLAAELGVLTDLRRLPVPLVSEVELVRDQVAFLIEGRGPQEPVGMSESCGKGQA
jgi:glutathione gamma-glutamylcysteinyltransferase